MVGTTQSPWFPKQASPVESSLQLFCFPHGGGDVSSFRVWQRAFGEEVEVVPVALPGRERRIREPLIPSIEQLADALIEPILDRARAARIVLFGHSMGALLAYEIAHRLAVVNSAPEMLVVSGAQPPHLDSLAPQVHQLSDSELVAHVTALEGTPSGVLDNPDLRDLLLPVLRADFRACEEYRLAERPLLDTPIVVLGGDRDPRVPIDALDHWSDLTTAKVQVRVFEGGHFFIFEHLAEVSADIRGGLRRAPRQRSTGSQQ